jgi:hypothetical protein
MKASFYTLTPPDTMENCGAGIDPLTGRRSTVSSEWWVESCMFLRLEVTHAYKDWPQIYRTYIPPLMAGHASVAVQSAMPYQTISNKLFLAADELEPVLFSTEASWGNIHQMTTNVLTRDILATCQLIWNGLIEAGWRVTKIHHTRFELEFTKDQMFVKNITRKTDIEGLLDRHPQMAVA